MKCLAVVLLLLTPPPGGRAQDLPAPPPTAAPDAQGDPRAPIWKAAHAALAAGNATLARQHLHNALWFDPFADAVLAELVGATSDGDDARLWLFGLLTARATADGALSPALGKLVPKDDAFLLAIAKARADSVTELLGQIERAAKARDLGAPLVRRHLREIAWRILRRSPMAWGPPRAALNDAIEPRGNAHVPVVAALQRVMKESLTNGKTALAIRAARCLRGLAAQAAFKDVKGPSPPDLTSVGSDADDALRRARAKLTATTTPLSVDELLQFDLEQGLAFTNAHRDFDAPGVALSPTGQYRIETVCGYETLLGAAASVEDHHARLAAWYGKDPFVGAPGTVRIVPEASGLEAEGAPYFWVGGFQSGDVTTVRFNASNIASLGRLLTHELTHRFDGRIYPGLPAWLAEGRAVYTGAAYGLTTDRQFIADHCSFGTIEAAMRKGYGGLTKLTQLLDGTIDDYRDNYSAGYALFIYLSTWLEGEQPVFGGRLAQYMEQIGKGRKDQSGWFTECFCDGKGGRPKDLKTFAEGFDTFLRGFYWLDRKPWTSRYSERVEAEPSPLVYDAPTWGFRRHRAEPWFGEQQAAMAGELLLEIGRDKDAAAALVWAFEIDEWSAERAQELADLLGKLKEDAAAWILRAENHRRRPALHPQPGAWPLLRSLPKTAHLLERLSEASKGYRQAGLPRTAAALAADHDELALLVGRPTIAEPADATLPPAPPFCDAPHYAGWLGWQEDELTGFEDYRVAGLWYDDREGSVHIGRHQPRDATGDVDPRAHQRDAFTRTREWLPAGRYRISARIHLTTSFVSGAMIVGHTRRDRNIRLHFSAGDYMFSIGQKTEAELLDGVSVSLSGVRDGEAAWSGQEAAQRVEFDPPKSSFTLEVMVDGPLLLASVDGQPIGTYHTVDGQPIDGHLGFAASFGAYRVERPTIEPLHRARLCHGIEPETAGLTLAVGETMDVSRLRNRTASGLPVSPRGTVVVWVPWPPEQEQWEGEDRFDHERVMRIATKATRDTANLLWKNGFDSPLVVALPSLLSDAERAQVAQQIADDRQSAPTCVIHDRRQSFARGDEEDGGELPYLLFIDPSAVLRTVSPYLPGTSKLPGDVIYWLSIHRGREQQD